MIKFIEIKFPYFSYKNFKIISRQLKEKAFSICHLNIRSLIKNIDKLKEILAFLNGSFSVVQRPGVTKQQIRTPFQKHQITPHCIKYKKIEKETVYGHVFTKSKI